MARGLFKALRGEDYCRYNSDQCDDIEESIGDDLVLASFHQVEVDVVEAHESQYGRDHVSADTHQFDPGFDIF